MAAPEFDADSILPFGDELVLLLQPEKASDKQAIETKIGLST